MAFRMNPGLAMKNKVFWLNLEQDEAPQWCERWFINHEIAPMNTIVVSTIWLFNSYLT